MEVKSRQQKSKIVTTIVEGIKKSAGEDGGGFVRKVRLSLGLLDESRRVHGHVLTF